VPSRCSHPETASASFAPTSLLIHARSGAPQAVIDPPFEVRAPPRPAPRRTGSRSTAGHQVRRPDLNHDPQVAWSECRAVRIDVFQSQDTSTSAASAARGDENSSTLLTCTFEFLYRTGRDRLRPGALAAPAGGCNRPRVSWQGGVADPTRGVPGRRAGPGAPLLDRTLGGRARRPGRRRGGRLADRRRRSRAGPAPAGHGAWGPGVAPLLFRLGHVSGA
jgi:hypothetical protein